MSHSYMGTEVTITNTTASFPQKPLLVAEIRLLCRKLLSCLGAEISLREGGPGQTEGHKDFCSVTNWQREQGTSPPLIYVEHYER